MIYQKNKNLLIHAKTKNQIMSMMVLTFFRMKIFFASLHKIKFFLNKMQSAIFLFQNKNFRVFLNKQNRQIKLPMAFNDLKAKMH